MNQFSAELAGRLQEIDKAKRDETAHRRRVEEGLREQEKERSAKRSHEIAREIVGDLSEENLLQLIPRHFNFRNERHAGTIVIDFFNPDTDYTSSAVDRCFDRAIMFAVEHPSERSKLWRTPIKVLSGFSYLRETAEIHKAIRADGVAQRLTELKEAGVAVKFVQRGARIGHHLEGTYQVEISYPCPK